MTDEERDRQRARWDRALAIEGLDDVHRQDFSDRGLHTKLVRPSARLLLLPPDPRAAPVRFDESFWAWFEDLGSADLGGGRAVRIGRNYRPTPNAAVITYEPGGYEKWSSYFAVHRSGAVECGLGDRAVWERKDDDGNVIRTFGLTPIVGHAWALLVNAARVAERYDLDGPFQLTVALVGTDGAQLGQFGEGWIEPYSYEHRLGPCVEKHLLWHLELENLPAEDAVRDAAYEVGDRVEDGWQVRDRRYLSRVGPNVGMLDTRQLAQ
jgi:hypothetical protein